MQHPHHPKFTPKFCKQCGNVGEVALQQYRDEVTSGAFPSKQFAPYKLGSDQETASFAEQLDAAGLHNAAITVALFASARARLQCADPYARLA